MGPEHEDEEAQQAETLREKSMTIKLKVENTMRWRWTKDDMGHDVSIGPFSFSSLR
jgi:RNA polymerase-associated protein LEO1